jgi:hypothetical protein
MSDNKVREHPERQDLRRFVRKGDRQVEQHLEVCTECRTAASLMRTALLAGRRDRVYARSDAMIHRLASIPTLAAGPTRRPVRASVVSDSWQAAAAAGMRGAGCGVERRLRFRARDMVIDLVVDRLGAKFECFLRMSRRGRPVPRFVLGLGNKKVLPSDVGFFSWAAGRPPQRLILWSSDISIELGQLKW